MPLENVERRVVARIAQVAAGAACAAAMNSPLPQPPRIGPWGRPKSTLIQPADGALQATDLVERMRAYAEASRAPNTWRAYQSDLKQFGEWCATKRVEALPAAATTVAAYLADHAGKLATSTLQRRL